MFSDCPEYFFLKVAYELSFVKFFLICEFPNCFHNLYFLNLFLFSSLSPVE